MPGERKAEIEYVKKLTDNIQTLRERAKERQRKKETKDIAIDEEEKLRTFQPGEKVFVHNHNHKSKLKSSLFGPYEIIERTGSKTYTIRNELEPDGREIVHIDDIQSVKQTSATQPEMIKALRASDKGKRVIKAIEAHKGRRGARQFLVAWIGLPESKRSWEKEADIRESIIYKNYMKNQGISLFSLIDMDILPIYADVVGTVLKHPDLLSSPDEVRENEETFLNKVI
ncbi:hypothetical protein ADUPG1_011244, partial [Aduncisulcus paluster]